MKEKRQELMNLLATLRMEILKKCVNDPEVKPFYALESLIIDGIKIAGQLPENLADKLVDILIEYTKEII